MTGGEEYLSSAFPCDRETSDAIREGSVYYYYVVRVRGGGLDCCLNNQAPPILPNLPGAEGVKRALPGDMYQGKTR